MRYVARGLIYVSVLLGAAAAVGCLSEVDSDTQGTGSVRLPLKTTTDAYTYRLANAKIAIAGPENRTITAKPDDEVLNLTVAQGHYVVSLQDGWKLQRIDGAGTVTTMSKAVLTSPNPLEVDVTNQGVAPVRFAFDVTGTAVGFGDGGIEVGIEVCETPGGCADTSGIWCDSTTDLCWTLSEPAPMPKAQAEAYCEGLAFAGRTDWRLPSIQEWMQVAKGCDDSTGTPHDVSFQSTCTLDASEDPTIAPCENSCPEGQGPSNGCYWPEGMGACSTTGYWSSTVSAGTLYFHGTSNWIVSLSDFASQAVRCVSVD